MTQQPTPTRPLIRSIAFEPDGSAVLEYCNPTIDAKANGVLLNHTLYVPAGADYDDEITDVLDAAVALFHDVAEDLPYLEPLRVLPREHGTTLDALDRPLQQQPHDEDDEEEDDDE